MAADASPELRQGYLFPVIEAPVAPVWLSALAPTAVEAAAANLMFQTRESLALGPFLPHWKVPPRLGKDRVVALRQRLAENYQTAIGREFDPTRLAPQSLDVSRMLDMAGAMVLGICLAAKPVDDDGRENPDGERMAICLGEESELEQDVVRILRRTRNAAVSAFEAGAGRTLALARFETWPRDGSTLEGVRAATGWELPILARTGLPNGSVWLRDDLALPQEARGFASGMLAALRELGVVSEGHDLVVDWRPETARSDAAAAGTDGRADDGRRASLLYAAVPAAMEGTAVARAEDLARERSPETPLEVECLRPVPSDKALPDLQKRIIAQDFEVGYRMRLASLPENAGIGRDVEILREEIAEREAVIELVRALSAPQMRLLRFGDAQLPALVDGLRAMPPEMLRKPGLRYAAAHSSGLREPTHFVLYDPSEFAIEGNLPEQYWRGRTEDRPIRYWLDPHAAEARRLAPDVAPAVFAPVRQRLLPAIDSFGGNLDQTLRLVLGSLFADASAVLDKEGAEPIYVFSPPSLPGADMDVELLDERWFKPMKLSLKWLNDYMIVRSPRVADPETLSRLAEDLYEGQIAEALRSEAAASVESLRNEWKERERELRGQIDGAVLHVAAEIRSSAERLRLGVAFLQDAEARIARLDSLIAAMREEVARKTDVAARISRTVPEQTARRYKMVAELQAELEAGEQAMREAERRVKERVRAIEKLEELLRAM